VVRGLALACALFAAAAGAEECKRCHVEVAEAWAESAHGRADTNEAFLRDFRRAPHTWCLGCHQPDRPARGVGCVACHAGASGAVRSSRAPSAEALEAHPVEVVPDLGSRCASCHQFQAAIGPEAMQATFDEWRALGAKASCARCHLPRGDHGLKGVRALSDGIVRASFAREGGGWRATLRAGPAGHRVPTGDPSRRLVVEVCADPGCADVVDTRALGRRFEVQGGAFRLREDSALWPGRPRTITLDDARGRAAYYRISIALADFEPRVPVAAGALSE
jgi:hypothetical protein